MPTRRAQMGQRGEAMARGFLQERGYHILESNYRCSYGEIDIIAQDGDQTVFVEVRTRLSTAYGTPEESLTPAKQQHLLATSQEYLQRHDMGEADCRIDLVSIRLGAGSQGPRIDHLRHAVQL